ncbi:hypothetical protein P4C99_20415 [Pontiellaceae bacterium B1224]|nr:hypothetical protein [Pontiellaceae bacterium B1224]
MKKVIFSVIVAIVLTRTALSNEYREFTNQDGKSIHARIVQYDAEGERVQLELQNRKKAWIQLSVLSEADRVYIQKYIQEKTSLASENAKDKPEPVKELSKKELEAIGEQYIQAWESGSYEKVKAFFLHPQHLTQSRFNECKERIDDIDIDKVGDGYIILDIDSNTYWPHLTDLPISDADERWVLFTPDGQIKYDSILLKHPIEIALKSMLVLYGRGEKYKWAAVGSNSNVLSEKTYTSLKNMGIPMFGLDLSGSPDEIDESLLKMTEWLLGEGDTWDSTEPNVFFPEELLKEYKESPKFDY